jgi:methyl-accepting chemotaxis protein
MRLGVRSQLLGSSAALLVLMAAVGLAAVVNLQSVDGGGSAMYNRAFVPITQLNAVAQAVIDEGRLVNKGIVQIGNAQMQTTIDTSIAADEKILHDNLAAYGATDLSAQESSILADVQKSYVDYGPLRDATRQATNAGNTSAAVAASDKASTARTSMQQGVTKLVQLHSDQAQALDTQNASTAQTAYAIVLGGLLLATLLGLGLSFFIARRITRGVVAVQAHLDAMRTEVGAFSGCLARLAKNDLSAEFRAAVKPLGYKSGDEIGRAAMLSNELLKELNGMSDSYETARTNLTATLGQVKDAAEGVARTSRELTEAAHQSGSASGQIAQTINQVASGAQDQAQAASSTSAAVTQLTGVIGLVGSGAAETTKKVASSSAAVARLASAIDAASAASAEVNAVSAQAASAASQGLDAVGQTVAGMARIKDAVDASASRVTALGAKSEQIGTIVETIDDIAEQTNLLALNAAIEAARAGEQGKGFAVVADEVRKLAERSGRATKEIADLIAHVQRETHAAVAAMQTGAAEVAAGADLADQAGASLEAIAAAVAATKSAVERITAAVATMGEASEGVVGATDAIAAIAARTNEAASRMTENANSVSDAVESIAAVSEENSAAAEEVSATTEEMSAQVEEVVASAATLAEMAGQLDQLVGRFTLAGHEGLAAQVEVFKKAHLRWVDRVHGLLEGRDKWVAADVPDHHGCSLGKWYDAVGSARFGALAAFGAIEAPHESFHGAVRAVIEAHDRGDRNAAASAALDVERLSGDVVRHLGTLASQVVPGDAVTEMAGARARKLRVA